MVTMHTANRSTEINKVEQVVSAAADAAGPWAGMDRSDRSQALRAVADRLDAAADELVPIGVRETHLSEPRLRSELRRTTFQLRMLRRRRRRRRLPGCPDRPRRPGLADGGAPS